MTIGEKVAMLLTEMKTVRETVERVEELQRLTNGRVSRLERREIERIAREEERRAAAERAAAAAADAAAAAAAAEERRDRRRAWVPGSVTAVVCIFVAGAVERWIFG